MKYIEFLKLRKFIIKFKKSKHILVLYHNTETVNKYKRKHYFQLLKLYNTIIFFKIYNFSNFSSFPYFWKYLRSSTTNKLLHFLKVNKQYTIFFFSYRVRNLFCIVWKNRNIETFFSSYLCSDRKLRSNFMLQLKIIRYLTYIYYKDISSNLKLHFTVFSVKIRHIIKLFFFWLSFYVKLFSTKKFFYLKYILINNKFSRGRVKKKMYPTKKRYLQRRSNSRVVLG